MYIHNVGHGQAIHAFTPNGQSIVIDLGCSDDFSPLEWLRGVTDTIDCLVITHPHGDHIDEILRIGELGLKVRQLHVPRKLTPEEVYRQNQRYYTDKLDAYFRYVAGWSTPIAPDDLVGTPGASGGFKLSTFCDAGSAPSNINNHSLVVAIEYARSKIIIPGDNEAPSWKALLDNPSFVNSMTGVDVLMASHHGRESGYCADLFAHGRKPNLCVISDGRVQDTDATGRYSYHAQGWKVNSRSGTAAKDRFAITTRTDGFVHIQGGYNGDQRPFLQVTAN